MKILIVSDAWYPQVNGVVRTYEHLRDELETRGITIKIIGPADFPVTVPTPGYAEIKLAIMPAGRIKKIIGEFGPDRIHVATEGPLGWAARNICVKRKIPFTTSYHTHFPDYVAKRIGKVLPFMYGFVHDTAVNTLRKFHNASHAVFTATQTLQDDLVSKGFTAPMKRLTRGVNLEIFHPPQNEDELQVKKQFKGPVATYVGRVAIEKNLEAFLDMKWEGSKVIVGDGPSMKYLKRKYPDAHFVGKKIGKELADHYRASDVFAFPSMTDTFGIVLIEALACGVPVAAYPIMGPQDIIVEPFLGCIDEDLSTAAYKALECGTPEERFNHVKEHYTWQTAGDQFMDALSYINDENGGSADQKAVA